MKFTINGKEYEGAKYNYNTSCAFEEYGVAVSDIVLTPMNVLRAYLSISSGMDIYEAGNEIEAHLIAGGDIQDIQKALGHEMSESGFFQTLLNKVKEDEESPETQEKKKK